MSGTVSLLDSSGAADTGALYSWTNQWYVDPEGVSKVHNWPLALAGWTGGTFLELVLPLMINIFPSWTAVTIQNRVFTTIVPARSKSLIPR